MRVIQLLLVLLLPLFPAVAQEPVRSDIVGRWSADARLFDRHIRARTTPLEAQLVFADDHTLTGRIGSARIPQTRPFSATTTRLEYRVRLDRPVHEHPDLKKDHLLIIVTLSPASGLDADFHLKSRFGFDPTIRVGHFDATRMADRPGPDLSPKGAQGHVGPPQAPGSAVAPSR